MSVLVKYIPNSPLTAANIEGVKDKLKTALLGRVEKAYLFGSVADGTFKIDSDIDLILIKDSSLPFVQRGTEFLDLFDIHPELDIVVYSEAEFDRQLARPGPGFWRSVEKSMRRLV
jgi:uncharacterized protein